MAAESGVAFLLFWIVLGGFVLIGMTIRNRQRIRELALRERIAMIEKGVLPPPEIDPGRFESFDRLERLIMTKRRLSPRASRYRSMGIMVVGLGFGLLLLITFAAGEPGIALGVGGGFVAVGAAFILNGVVTSHSDEADGALSAPAPPTEPPANVAP